MPRVIKNRQVVDDHWVVLGLQDALCCDVSGSRLIVPLDEYLFRKKSNCVSETIYGIWLHGYQGPELGEFVDYLLALPVIAIYFSDFTDGRGFSLATLLRERYDYKGELRAFGNILPDQLFYLQRCGFNAFSFGKEVNLQEACKALNDFSESYQVASDQSIPLFRQRSVV